MLKTVSGVVKSKMFMSGLKAKPHWITKLNWSVIDSGSTADYN